MLYPTRYHVLLRTALVTAFTFTVAAAPVAADDDTLRQNFGDGDYKLIEDDTADLPGTIIQNTPRRGGRDVYGEDLADLGLHVRTGRATEMTSDIKMHNLNTSHVIGVHGEGTKVHYRGRWEADGGNAFPHMLLTEGGHFIFEEESQMDMVMDGSYFTRQLWVKGDGTGIIELAEGFNADQTVNEPVADAMGTIRLGGATLITHHTRNMPANTRPDGRGGHYQNGHVVFERVEGNTWIVKSNNQLYKAQVDFDTSGTIDTQATLTHAGHRRVALPVGPGGHFTSTGAFRTTSSGVTITKDGPAMLSLDGEQSYHPDTTFEVEQGLLRMSTNPGLGRAADEAGAHLVLNVRNEAKLHIGAPLSELKKLQLHDEAEAWIDRDCTLDASEGVSVAEGARLHLNGEVRGEVSIRGRMHLDGPRGPATIHGDLAMNGTLDAGIARGSDRPALKVNGMMTIGSQLAVRFHGRGDTPERVVLVEADVVSGAFSDGTQMTCAADEYRFNVAYEDGRIELRDIEKIDD